MAEPNCSKLGRSVQDCIFSPYSFNLGTKYTITNADLYEIMDIGIKTKKH